MHVTIGILAHDEAAVIEHTIASLLRQSVFTRPAEMLPQMHWEIVVVPNGCRDDTHAVAERSLAAATAHAATGRLSYRVVSLERPGKSHAWNQLVHEIAAAATDIFVMMDADIEFGHDDTVANCVQRLLDDAWAWAVVDLPLKDFHRKAEPTWLERLSMRASQSRRNDAIPGLSGQFYVVSASRLRGIWMPPDLSVEDGFLQAMIITDGFRVPADYTRVARAANATHFYEGLTRLRDVLRHEERLAVGWVLNCFLCWDMLLFITPRDGPGAGDLVRRLNAQDPSWYRRTMANQIEIRGRWAIRTNQLWRRVAPWWALPAPRRLAKLPAMLAWTLFDGIVLWRANRKLVSGQAIGYW
jgi:glycosyltransferase involved in cell wall biosynthesis